MHIPFGYDGISSEAAASLSRVMEEQGPIYFHCHHGQHRGPAAAAIACVASGEADGKTALAILRQAGTSEKYKGLWRGVAQFRIPPPDTAPTRLTDGVTVAAMTSAMAQIGRAFDNLKACERSGWTSPKDHPDVAPGREARVLREGFERAVKTPTLNNDQRLKSWMIQAADNSRALERTLNGGKPSDATPIFNTLKQSCTQCHEKHRDG